MSFSDTSADSIIAAAVTAPATGSTPKSIAELLSPGAVTAIGAMQPVQVEVVPESVDVLLRDSTDTVGRPDDYFRLVAQQPEYISTLNGLSGIFLVSSAADAKVRLLIHCRRF